jgi:hypothetical protein
MREQYLPAPLGDPVDTSRRGIEQPDLLQVGRRPAAPVVPRLRRATWQALRKLVRRQPEVDGELLPNVRDPVILAIPILRKQRTHEGLEVGDRHARVFATERG